MTQVTCRLTAKNRDQLRNPTLGNRVWPTFFTRDLRKLRFSHGFTEISSKTSLYSPPLSSLDAFGAVVSVRSVLPCTVSYLCTGRQCNVWLFPGPDCIYRLTMNIYFNCSYRSCCSNAATASMRPSATGVARSVVVCVRVCVRPAKVDEPIDNQYSICLLGTDSGCTLAPHGEYNWTVHARRRCGLVSSYFVCLVLLLLIVSVMFNFLFVCARWRLTIVLHESAVCYVWIYHNFTLWGLVEWDREQARSPSILVGLAALMTFLTSNTPCPQKTTHP